MIWPMALRGGSMAVSSDCQSYFVPWYAAARAPPALQRDRENAPMWSAQRL